jgi:subtilisin family serine protease
MGFASLRYRCLSVFVCTYVAGCILPGALQLQAAVRDPGIPHLKTDLRDPSTITITKNGEKIVVRSVLHAPRDRFFWEREHNSKLTETVRRIVVEYAAGSDTAAARQRHVADIAGISTVREIGNGRAVLCLENDAAPALRRLSADPAVRYAYPLLYDVASLTLIVPTDHLVICMTPGARDIDELCAGHGLESVKAMPLARNQWLVRLVRPKEQSPEKVAAAVRADPNVAWAEPNWTQGYDRCAVPNDPRWSKAWHLHCTGQTIGGGATVSDNDVDAPEAWDITTGSAGVSIAILDDGVQQSHPDLSANIDSRGYDFSDDDSNPNPAHADDSHGTACAGVAAAVGNNSLGVTGVAYGSRILPIKIIKGPDFLDDAGLASAIRYAAQYADVISCSWGGGIPSTTLASAVADAKQDGVGGRGSVVFFASANDGDIRGYELSGFPSGSYTMKWVYSKNSSISEGEDTCWVDSVVFPNGSSQNFDSLTPPALPSGWSSSGSGSWVSEYEDAVHPADSGTRVLRATGVAHSGVGSVGGASVTSPAGGVLQYFMRVQSENNSSSIYQDYGAVEVNGTKYLRAAGTVAYPGAQPSTIAIGSVGPGEIKAAYSQYGPQLDLVAPSSGGRGAYPYIDSTDRTGSDGYNTAGGTSGNYCKADGVSGFSGTSSSTPLAAGIGALVRSVNADLSPAQVRNILRETADKIHTGYAGYTGRQTGRNDYYGWGRINAHAAVTEAQQRPDLLALGQDLKITEVAPSTGGTKFIEIYNQSATTTHALENLALTDNEAGADSGEGCVRFPDNTTVPPRGVAVVVVGAATATFLSDVAANAGGGGGPAGGAQVFETTDSGLSYGGSPVGNMESIGGTPFLGTTSENVMLTVTDGAEVTYLSEVIDGMVYGTPTASADSAFGVAPKTAETATYAPTVGLGAATALQRTGTADTDDSAADFSVFSRTPGRVPLSAPTAPPQSLTAAAQSDSAIRVAWTRNGASDDVLVAWNTTASFGTPTDGVVYNAGNPLGGATVLYRGSNLNADHGGLASETPYYYKAWSVGSGSAYSAGIEASATTLTGPITVFPYEESFDSGFGAWAQTGERDWSRDSGTTPSTSTGPSGAHDGTWFVYTEATSAFNKRFQLEAVFDLSSLTNPEFEFHYHMYGATMGTLAVDLYAGSWQSNVWSKTGQQQTSSSEAWRQATIPLAAYAGNPSVLIRFRGITGSSYTSDMAVDLVRCGDTVLTITTPSLPTGSIGRSYTTTLEADNGTAPYTWTLQTGTLPSGLALGTDGVLSGMPMETADTSITVQVRDAIASTATRTFRLVIAPPVVDHLDVGVIPTPQGAGHPIPLVLSARTIDGVVVTDYAQSVYLETRIGATHSTGVNLDFEAGQLAPWTPLSLSSSPGPYQLVQFNVDGTGSPSTAFRIAPNSGTPDGISQSVQLVGGGRYTFDVDIAEANESTGGANAGVGWVRLYVGATLVDAYSFFTSMGHISGGETFRAHLHGEYTPPATGTYTLKLTFERSYNETDYIWAYADDITISSVVSQAIAMHPTNTPAFVRGTWSGLVTVQAVATQAHVRVWDDAGHTGQSGLFDVMHGDDRDGDDIPDFWEIRHRGDTSSMNAGTDSDGDGANDGDEYVAGTQPTNPASVFELVEFEKQEDNEIVLKWSSEVGRLYNVGWSPGVPGTPFSSLASNLPATPPQNVWTDRTGRASGFYRILGSVEGGL